MIDWEMKKDTRREKEKRQRRYGYKRYEIDKTNRCTCSRGMWVIEKKILMLTNHCIFFFFLGRMNGEGWRTKKIKYEISLG